MCVQHVLLEAASQEQGHNSQKKGGGEFRLVDLGLGDYMRFAFEVEPFFLKFDELLLMEQILHQSIGSWLYISGG